ncbi:MAG: c-type cytochrome biogenesis protein CcmI, partial [Maritimibacter sp.]|nr:c-type cytochrome biogenesis protein CcmI [Maritimibacter sp.]
MLGFWIIAAATALATIAILGRALLGGGSTDAGTDAYDVQVYRDQLSELDRDVARGVLNEAEAERARVETSRRLLEADRRAQAAEAPGTAPRGLSLAVLAVSGVVILAGGIGLYSIAGAPGTPDLPLATRIELAETARAQRATQAEIEAELPDWAGPPPGADAEYLDMVEQLRTAVATRPDEVEGQELLARHEGALGNFRAAHAAMARAIALKGDAATAEDYTAYAELLALAANGRVSPEAEAAIRQALELNPDDGIALYYLGLMYGQNDRPDRGFPIWRDLLERSTPDAPWVGPIRAQIGQLAAMAGVDYTPPAMAAAGPFAGPSQEDMEAAADMSPEDRAEMIRGMVDRLMNRLATEGGTAQEWAQLIGALAVVGDTERARMIWGEAQTVYAGNPDALALIDGSAANAGLESPLAVDAGAAPAPGAAPAAPATLAVPEAAPGAATIDQLMQRLASEGGPPEVWSELIAALAEAGDSARARAIWGEAQSAFAAHPDAVAQIDEAATAAGLSDPVGFSAPRAVPTPAPAAPAAPAAPGALPGPDADDIAAAAEMSAEDRTAMIEGMVAGLADTLTTEGGPPERWVMLLNSLGQLGDTERAAEIWTAAQAYFADDAAALDQLRPVAEAL